MSNKGLYIKSVETSEKGSMIEIGLQMGSDSYQVYFRSNDTTLAASTEAILALVLLPCMREGGDMVAQGKISQQFLNANDTVQDIYCAWDSSLHRVKIKAVVPEKRKPPKENRIGIFFSGGVDSFYTFLKHRDEITDLIFVHGFDIRLDDNSLRKRTSEMVRKIGSSFGKRVIEVETNLRLFLDSYVPWGPLGHGAALASVGHFLFPLFKRIYISASFAYADLFPWGSHPLLDPLWSTETLEFVHDGCESTRIDKVALISEFDIALQTLRVCHKNPNSAYNCGLCEKCIRTMINLHIVGALNRCTTLDNQIKIKHILELILLDDDIRVFIKKNLQALANRPEDQELYNALHKVLNEPRQHKL